MLCQVCGVEAATKSITFRQNIGMLVMRRSAYISGKLCKRCIHRHFWKMTGTTLVLGPWGTISLMLAPLFILNNVGQYITCVTMPGVPRGAGRATLTDDAFTRLEPHAAEIFDRLHAGEDFTQIADSISASADVTPGQVLLFTHEVARGSSH